MVQNTDGLSLRTAAEAYGVPRSILRIGKTSAGLSVHNEYGLAASLGIGWEPFYMSFGDDLNFYAIDESGLNLVGTTRINGTLLSELFAEKAPAGYGLGPAAKTVDSWDNALGSGFYQSIYGGPLANRWFYGFVHSYDESGEYVIQKIWTNENGTYSTDFSSAERRRYAGTWGEWEWVNPPMRVGVEYRTTERHQGKVVYVQTKSYGTPTSGATLTFGSSYTIFRHEGMLGNSYIPYGANGDTWYAYTQVYSGGVHLVCSSNFATSAYPWTHTAWYTKD